MALRFLELKSADVELMEAELRTLCARSGAESVVLLDLSGVVLASHRIPEKMDGLLFGALLSGNFAATEELARRLGVLDFRVMYHEGRRQNLYFDKVTEETVLVVLFKDSNALGRVKLFSEKALPELARMVGEITRRPETTPDLPQARSAAEYLARLAQSIQPGDGLDQV